MIAQACLVGWISQFDLSCFLGSMLVVRGNNKWFKGWRGNVAKAGGVAKVEARRHSNPWTLNPDPRTVNPKPLTPKFQASTLKFKP